MGRMNGSHGVKVVPLEEVPPIQLPGGSWSRVILTGDRVGSATALGFSSFAGGIIALEGYVDLALGHVSGREPGSRTVWIKRQGVTLDEVEPEDVSALDLDAPAALSSRDYHLGSVMHAEVYRARDDVNAVING